MDFFTFLPDSAPESVLCERSSLSLCLSLFFDFDFFTGVGASSWIFLSLRFNFDFFGITFSCWISSKSGSETFEGEVVETDREGMLSLEGFKDNFIEDLRMRDFGGSIGVVETGALIDADGLSARLRG